MRRFASRLLLIDDFDDLSVLDPEDERTLLDRTVVPELSEESLGGTSSRYEVHVSLSVGSTRLNEQPAASIHVRCLDFMDVDLAAIVHGVIEDQFCDRDIFFSDRILEFQKLAEFLNIGAVGHFVSPLSFFKMPCANLSVKVQNRSASI